MKKTACITGASRGIGEAISRALAKNGYHLALCCRNSREKLYTLAEELRQNYHIQVLCFVGDVGDETFVNSMISETLKTFGQLDVLVNNAGISFMRDSRSSSEKQRFMSVSMTPQAIAFT